MADVLRDRKITQDEADKMMKPLELDLTAIFNIIQEDILSMISNVGDGVTPESLIRSVDRATSGLIDFGESQEVKKTLNTFEAIYRRVIVYGDIPVRIEQEIGSTRRGTDRDGNEWETLFHNPYGYFEETVGTDGDEIDCYLGNDETNRMVYIIHQRDPVTGEYDEDKCMVYFPSAEEAVKTYQKHYDRPGMFGGMTEVTEDQFREMLQKRVGVKLDSSGITGKTDRQKLFENLEKFRSIIGRKTNYSEKLKRMKQRRDPDGIE